MNAKADALVSAVVVEQHNQAFEGLKQLARHVATRRDELQKAERILDEATDAYGNHEYDIGYNLSTDSDAVNFQTYSHGVVSVRVKQSA